jgi:hypothetical protein
MFKFTRRTPVAALMRESCARALPRPVRHAAVTALFCLAPTASFACACGCGVFDVGTASMFPQNSGAMGFVEYDFMDQDKNWSGSSRASADANSDKRIRTSFMNVGLEYQFNRSWGMSVEVPYWHRYFQTQDNSGNIVAFTHGALGDLRLKGVYTGFSPDMSTGITFGIKLPTGDATYTNFDPDTQIGSGSTDTLLGIYHLGSLPLNSQWRYFLQAQWDEPVRHKANYRPGNEVIATAGTYYEGWQVSPTVRIAPVLQLNATYRGHDGGPDGHPQDSGYTRLLVTPGIEVDFSKAAIYVDVGLPVHTNSSGNQLVSSQFWRMNVSYKF